MTGIGFGAAFAVDKFYLRSKGNRVMPEGPEIHRAADRVHAALSGRPAQAVFFGLPHLESLGEGLTGQQVVSVTAHGKAMLTEFEDGRCVFSHNQLYGRWYVVKAGSRPSTRRSLRFMVENEDKAALLYSASTLEVLTPDDIPLHPFLAKLGPDPLHAGVTPGRIEKQLKSSTFRGRSLGALLLDQS
ncbi:MAG: DNA-formamidopyrimidine glycosylase family protein, partial [Myxococcota bacterium]